jgi:hypothetical protein
MLHRLTTPARRLEEDSEVLADLLLTDILG